MEKELIPGLPNEIAMECLVRVPRLHSYKLGMVHRLWKSAAASSNFTRRQRQLVKVSRSNDKLPGKGGKFMILFQEDIDNHEQMINNGTDGAGARCQLILYDIVKGVWRSESLAGNFPAACLPKCCVISLTGDKLVVMGDLTTRDIPRDEGWASRGTSVWVYNFSNEQWGDGAPMPGPRRLFFAHASDGVGTIFVAGGWNPVTDERLRSAMAYDVESDEWIHLPPMIEARSYCFGAVVDNKKKFYVATCHCCSEAFDLTTLSWSEESKFENHAFYGHETFPEFSDDLDLADFNHFSSACFILLLTKPLRLNIYNGLPSVRGGGDVQLRLFLELEHSHIQDVDFGYFGIISEKEVECTTVLPKKYSAAPLRGASLTKFLLQKLYDNFN